MACALSQYHLTRSVCYSECSECSECAREHKNVSEHVIYTRCTHNNHCYNCDVMCSRVMVCIVAGWAALPPRSEKRDHCTFIHFYCISSVFFAQKALKRMVMAWPGHPSHSNALLPFFSFLSLAGLWLMFGGRREGHIQPTTTQSVSHLYKWVHLHGGFYFTRRESEANEKCWGNASMLCIFILVYAMRNVCWLAGSCGLGGDNDYTQPLRKYKSYVSFWMRD